MTSKPPRWCLSLLWGLTLLTSVKTTTAEANATNAVALIPAQRARMRTPSTAHKDRGSVEERVLPSASVRQVVQHEFQPFAGKLLSKEAIDKLHKQKFLVDSMRRFDDMFDVDVINELTHFSEDNFHLLVLWFGTKSPEDQEVVLDLLVAHLKGDPLSRDYLLTFLNAGKTEANVGFRLLAAAVEEKWLMSISTNEMYDALGLPYIWDDEEFVRHVGRSIWEKFRSLGEKEFTAFMLTKMRERSEDELLWARLIYKLEKDKSVQIPLAGVFDDLVHTKAVAAGNCRPIVAVKVLMSPQFLKLYHGAAGTGEQVGAVVVDELFKWSKDELMWAKLIYILQNDKSVPTIPSSVFDHLLQPYEKFMSEEDQFTPSQAVKYLTSSELSRIDDHLFTGNEVDAKLLAALYKKSHDELMWAKLLFMLKNDKSVSAPVSGVLTALLHSWTEWPTSATAIAEQTTLRMSKEILINPKFYYLYVFAHFASDNPDVFLLEKLREQSTDEIVWAQALNAVGEDQSVHTPLSGVLDALLHSWVDEPYKASTLADDQPALIGAYKLLLECSMAVQNRHWPPSPQEAEMLVNVLLERLNGELMWAKFLHKLQQDQAFSVVASSAFDALLRLKDSAQTPNPMSPQLMVEYLRSPLFLIFHKFSLLKDNPDAALLSHLFELSPNQVMWAKVFYIMQNDESESKVLYSNLLEFLLLYWTYHVAATSSSVFVESKSYLESQSFVNLIAYARFLSDDPDTFVLQKLRERSTDEFVWARLLNKLRKEHLKLQRDGYQPREEYDALAGILNALLHSWVGKPYDATANLNKKRILIVAYDFLTSQDLATSYSKKTPLGKLRADNEIRNRLIQLSTDDVMWAKLLTQLQKDIAIDLPLSGVFQILLQDWKKVATDAAAAKA